MPSVTRVGGKEELQLVRGMYVNVPKANQNKTKVEIKNAMCPPIGALTLSIHVSSSCVSFSTTVTSPLASVQYLTASQPPHQSNGEEGGRQTREE